VLLPYDSRDQVTSGVLVKALAAGKPVIATTFPHAVEMLSSGAGILVPHHDGACDRQRPVRVLTDPELAERMAHEARRLAPALLRNAVAVAYRRLAHDLLTHGQPPRLGHTHLGFP
jgi:polysaccharide biosynthesis protein PslF